MGDFRAREYDDLVDMYMKTRDDVLVDNERDDDSFDRYIICNSVKAGLTDREEDWVGWSSINAALTGDKSSFNANNRVGGIR